MKAMQKVLVFIVFSVFVMQAQARQENSFCERIKKNYLNEFAVNKPTAVETLSWLNPNGLVGESNEYYFLGMHPVFISSEDEEGKKHIIFPINNKLLKYRQYYLGLIAFLWPSPEEKDIWWSRWRRVDKNKERFETIMQEEDDPFLLMAASNFLVFLYFNEGDIEKSYSYLHERLMLSFFETSTLYEMALFHSKICEKELERARAKVRLEKLADFEEIKKLHPNMIDISNYIKYYMDIHNYPKDYIQAYYWANLAVERNLPLAVEMRELIAENMTAEEIEQALNYFY